MKTVRKPVYWVLSTMLVLGTAQAKAEEVGSATLMEVTGSVLVNQGKNYEVAQSGMKLAPNARVVVKDKGSALVTSKQGCATRLGANSLFVVKQPDPCHGGSTAQKIDPVANPSANAGGSSGSGGSAGGGASQGSTGFGSTANMAFLGAVGGAAVVGGVVGGLSASGEFDSSSDNNTDAARAASYGVIAAGGSAKAAAAAFSAAANGGNAATIRAAVLVAGGSTAAANAAVAAFAAAEAGGTIVTVNNAVQPCISPVAPNCR